MIQYMEFIYTFICSEVTIQSISSQSSHIWWKSSDEQHYYWANKYKQWNIPTYFFLYSSKHKQFIQTLTQLQGNFTEYFQLLELNVSGFSSDFFFCSEWDLKNSLVSVCRFWQKTLLIYIYTIFTLCYLYPENVTENAVNILWDELVWCIKDELCCISCTPTS